MSYAAPHSACGLLTAAWDAINERARTRDVDAERSMGRTVATFGALTGQTLSETDGWLFMVALKLARARQGQFHADDYVDAAAYCALAGECAAADVAACRPDNLDTVYFSEPVTDEEVRTGFHARADRRADMTPNPELPLPRGRYKDRAVEDVPSDYLRWLCREWEDSEIVEAAEAELRYRDDHRCHFEAWDMD